MFNMSFQSFCTYTRTLLLLLSLPASMGLRNVYMVIPEAVERGKPAVISCLYDLENEDLYQVKWYRGGRELCRYSPRDVPPFKIFPLRGMDVDIKGSDAKQVTISAATEKANGGYTCEVSADAPSFVTAQIHGHMYVVDLPKTELEFIGLKPRYKPGMKLKAECICHDTMPPANMSFFVNNKPALSQHVWHRVSGGENGSLWTAYITIQFVVQKHHFINGKIRIRCSAFIYSIYFKSYERVTDGERLRPSIAPMHVTNEAILYPTLITTDNASCKLKSLWTISYLSLIVFIL